VRVVVGEVRMWTNGLAGGYERRRGVAVGEYEGGQSVVINECGGAGGDERRRGVVVGEYEGDG
jgi:hypothetical protein